MIMYLAEPGETQTGWGNPIGLLVAVALVALLHLYLTKIKNPSPPPPAGGDDDEFSQVEDGEVIDDTDDPEGVVDQGAYKISYEDGNHTRVNVTKVRRWRRP